MQHHHEETRNTAPAIAFGVEDADVRRIYQHVVLQAVRDAYAVGIRRQAEKLEAIAWFERGGADFRHVCEMAGLCPDHVQSVYREGLDMPRFVRAGTLNVQ